MRSFGTLEEETLRVVRTPALPFQIMQMIRSRTKGIIYCGEWYGVIIVSIVSMGV